MKLKIHEIFWSFQGEGVRMGYPAIFIRLAGCQLQCPECDTSASWSQGTWMDIQAIVSQVETYRLHYPQSQVTLTGGEPLEQDLTELVTQLKCKDFFLTIETNGTHFQEIAIDWWTVSPKEKSAYKIHPGLLSKINEIKIIVTPSLARDTLEQIHRLLPENKKKIPLFLQPESHDPDKYKRTFALFCQCQQQGLGNIRAGIQLHTLYQVK